MGNKDMDKSRTNCKSSKGAAFYGLMCPACWRVYSGSSSDGYDQKSLPCESCGAVGPRDLFPSGGAGKLLDEIFRHEGHDFLPVILFASAFESLLYEFLIYHLAVKNGLSVNGAAAILKQNRGFKLRRSLFKSLVGTSLKQEIKVKGFYDDAVGLIERRNKFLHVTPYAIGSGDVEKSLVLSTNLLNVFINLHNKFIAGESLNP